MRVRHLIAAADVDGQGSIIAAERARHGVIVAGQIAALGAPIDPLTHLNLDFGDHRLGECLVVEQLEVGAAVLADADGFRVAYTPPQAYQHLGLIDVTARRLAWQRQFQS